MRSSTPSRDLCSGTRISTIWYELDSRAVRRCAVTLVWLTWWRTLNIGNFMSCRCRSSEARSRHQSLSSPSFNKLARLLVFDIVPTFYTHQSHPTSIATLAIWLIELHSKYLTSIIFSAVNNRSNSHSSLIWVDFLQDIKTTVGRSRPPSSVMIDLPAFRSSWRLPPAQPTFSCRLSSHVRRSWTYGLVPSVAVLAWWRFCDGGLSQKKK